jgi:L-ascorbate metabolism protein UlaG (beta-lactamase superfamily)
MELTKFGHSCVRIDDGDRSLVIDPGSFSDVAAALDGVHAVLITHEHADHLDVDAVRGALAADPRLQLFAPPSVVARFDAGEQAVAVGPGESFDAAGFSVRTLGGQHAVIHPQIPVIANVAYDVAGLVLHPGDSFVVPLEPVNTLLLPTTAPWSKISEVLDYAITVRAAHTLPIHDGLVNDRFDGLLRRNAEVVAGPYGVTLGRWDGSVPI